MSPIQYQRHRRKLPLFNSEAVKRDSNNINSNNDDDDDDGFVITVSRMKSPPVDQDDHRGEWNVEVTRLSQDCCHAPRSASPAAHQVDASGVWERDSSRRKGRDVCSYDDDDDEERKLCHRKRASLTKPSAARRLIGTKGNDSESPNSALPLQHHNIYLNHDNDNIQQNNGLGSASTHIRAEITHRRRKQSGGRRTVCISNNKNSKKHATSLLRRAQPTAYAAQKCQEWGLCPIGSNHSTDDDPLSLNPRVAVEPSAVGSIAVRTSSVLEESAVDGGRRAERVALTSKRRRLIRHRGTMNGVLAVSSPGG